jgi:hypothetical protein
LDEWDLIGELATLGHPTLPWLWQQHNEHRILFYKLLLTDFAFFKGQFWPMYAGIFACQVALAAIIAFMLRYVGGLQGLLWRASLGLTLFCVFCPSQWENFYWGFQFSFLLVNVLFGLALLSLLLYARSIQEYRDHGRRISCCLRFRLLLLHSLVRTAC